jgi:hypothetical protein
MVIDSDSANPDQEMVEEAKVPEEGQLFHCYPMAQFKDEFIKSCLDAYMLADPFSCHLYAVNYQEFEPINQK